MRKIAHPIGLRLARAVLVAAFLGATAGLGQLDPRHRRHQRARRHEADLAFDLVNGGAPANSVTISKFATDGALGTSSSKGSVTGAFPASVTLSDGSFFSEYLQTETLGKSLSFVVDTTGLAPDRRIAPRWVLVLLPRSHERQAALHHQPPDGRERAAAAQHRHGPLPDLYSSDKVKVTAVIRIDSGAASFCDATSYDNGAVQTKGLFTDLRRGTGISADYGSCLLNLTGSTGAAGDMWITMLNAPDDPTPPTFSCVSIDATVTIHKFDNRKAVGFVANYDPATQKGLFLGLYDNGNSDGLTLSTFNGATGKLTRTVKTLFLSAKIQENVGYFLELDICNDGTTLTATGTVKNGTARSECCPSPGPSRRAFHPPGRSASPARPRAPPSIRACRSSSGGRSSSSLSARGEPRQRRAVDDADPLAAEVHPAAILEAAQQPRHDLAHAAELVGECLVRGMDLAALGVAIDEQRGEPLVELLVGDRLDDLHQPGEPLAEQREHVTAKRLVARHQRVEFRRRHDQQLDVGLGDAGRVVLGVAEQAASRQQARFAGLHAVELQLAAVGIALQHADGPGEDQRKAGARRVLAEHHGAGRHLAVDRRLGDVLERGARRPGERRKRCRDPRGERRQSAGGRGRGGDGHRSRHGRAAHSTMRRPAGRAMDLTAVAFPLAWTIAGWIVAVPILALAYARAPWPRFGESEPVHVWYGTIFCVVVLWSVQATVGEGFTFHLLGSRRSRCWPGRALALVGGAIAWRCRSWCAAGCGQRRPRLR